MTVPFTNATLRSSADDLYATNIVDDEVIRALYSLPVMGGLVRNRSLIGKPTNTLRVPAWPALTAAAVAENADILNTQIATTSADISVSEVGIAVAISDSQGEDDILSGLEEYGAQGGDAVGDKVDADLAANLGNFSNTTGSDADAWTLADQMAARRALRARDVRGRLYTVLHPIQIGQLQSDIVVNGGNVWGAGTQSIDEKLGWNSMTEGSLFNDPILGTSNVPTGGTTGYYGGMFEKDAITLVWKRRPRVEFDRDPSARLTQIVVTVRYGTGETSDTRGQTLISDTTAV